MGFGHACCCKACVPCTCQSALLQALHLTHCALPPLPHRAAKLNFPEEAGGAAAQPQPASAPPPELGQGPGGGAAGGESAGWVCGGVRLLLCVGQGVGMSP